MKNLLKTIFMTSIFIANSLCFAGNRVENNHNKKKIIAIKKPLVLKKSLVQD